MRDELSLEQQRVQERLAELRIGLREQQRIERDLRSRRPQPEERCIHAASFNFGPSGRHITEATIEDLKHLTGRDYRAIRDALEDVRVLYTEGRSRVYFLPVALAAIIRGGWPR